jgi:hypothetical protein
MARPGKWIVILLGSIGLLTVGLVAAICLFFVFSFHASKIVDFHPTQFSAYAAAPFFYSIGDELKFSDHIDPQAPTLLRGAVGNFLVSPEKIAVVTRGNPLGGNLVIVDRSGPSQRTITPVNSDMSANFSGADNSKLIGQHYFRDTGFQWSRDAKSLYLMGDTYLRAGQASSKNGELWRFDLDTGKLQLVLKPFPIEQYFFGLNNGIYFWISLGPKGPLQLQYFDGKTISNIGDPGAAQISVDQLSTRFTEQPFYSFDEIAYMMHILSAKGVHFEKSGNDREEALEIGSRPYLRVTMGSDFEVFSCLDNRNSVFLPGDRYLLFNANRCGNCNGLLLIDSVTGQYQRLPRNTRAYITLNTVSYPHYEIDRFGSLLPD